MATKQLSLFWQPDEEAQVPKEPPKEPKNQSEEPEEPATEDDDMIELLRAADECAKCHVKPVFYTSPNHISIQGYRFTYVGMKCPLCGFSCGGRSGEDMYTVEHWNDCNRKFNR